MISYTKVDYHAGGPSADAYVPGTKYVEGVCLSTDTKPVTGIENGSVLIEMDTGKVYFFDEEGGAWTEWGA